jgi:hypothetical protein
VQELIARRLVNQMTWGQFPFASVLQAQWSLMQLLMQCGNVVCEFVKIVERTAALAHLLKASELTDLKMQPVAVFLV